MEKKKRAVKETPAGQLKYLDNIRKDICVYAKITFQKGNLTKKANRNISSYN